MPRISSSAVAGQNFLGEPNTAEQNLRGPGEKPRKIFEIFIPEIAGNAPNFMN